jgi:hypothetical protein
MQDAPAAQVRFRVAGRTHRPGQERTVAVDGFAPSQLGMACKARGLALPSVDRHGGHH